MSFGTLCDELISWFPSSFLLFLCVTKHDQKYVEDAVLW